MGTIAQVPPIQKRRVEMMRILAQLQQHPEQESSLSVKLDNAISRYQFEQMNSDETYLDALISRGFDFDVPADFTGQERGWNEAMQHGQ